jgi:hypothetical protein
MEIPILETKRLRLRPLRVDDFEPYHAMCSDPEVMEFIGQGKLCTPLESWRQIAAILLVLIGAGGVGSGADAYAKIRAGACVVQLYTALIYQGAGLVRRIKRDLAARVRADGFASVVEARGRA